MKRFSKEKVCIPGFAAKVERLVDRAPLRFFRQGQQPTGINGDTLVDKSGGFEQWAKVRRISPTTWTTPEWTFLLARCSINSSFTLPWRSVLLLRQNVVQG
jgi:hypothetical protein